MLPPQSDPETTGAINRPIAHTVDAFEGRFRAIPTIQLCLVWWLYRDSHITKRQLRIYFALQEMAERRRYTKTEEGGQKRKPFYTVAELASLVGGRGSDRAESELRSDVRKLDGLGLLSMDRQQIVFARSPDQINVDDLTAFWIFWDEIPNRKRTVPVPRRTLRALAAGFSMAVTGVLIAMMIRSIHWHKKEGEYRVDGRTKGTWIAEVFGISRKAVSQARAHLIAIGWIEPQETSQTLLNRYGNHDKINVDWSHKTAGMPVNDDGESTSPNRQNAASFTSPLKTEKLSSNEEDLKNKKPETVPVPDHPMLGSRKEQIGKRRTAQNPVPSGTPKLRAIDPSHLSHTPSLLELHRQAIAAKLSDDSEAGQIRFFALAERARSRGAKPAALFIWLLTNGKFEFITQADEDAAVRRLKDHFYPPQPRLPIDMPAANPNAFNADDRVVKVCCDLARQHRIHDPFMIARKTKQWTREKWNEAKENFEIRFGAIG